MATRILGLRIECASIGWALLELAPDSTQPGSVVDLGVRVFTEAVDRDNSGLERSKNSWRAECRRGRRLRRRRKRRIAKLIQLLRSTGLLPQTDYQLAEVLKMEPYSLRARALDHKLEPYQLGRIMLHINSRRGFKSHRRDGRVRESGLVQRTANEFADRMSAEKCRTLGEYFARHTPHEDEPPVKRIRGYRLLRGLYLDEFNQIWSIQQRFYPHLLTPAFMTLLRDDVIFFQRRLHEQGAGSGFCYLEKDEPRSVAACWDVQMLRCLQELNKLRCIDTNSGVERLLSISERETLISQLTWRTNLDNATAYSILNWPSHLKFSLELSGKRGSVRGNIIGAAIAEAIGLETVRILNPSELHEMTDSLLSEEDDQVIVQRAIAQWNLSSTQAMGLISASRRFPKGRYSLSLKAVRRLMPILVRGATMFEAMDEVGYHFRHKTRNSVIHALPLPWDESRRPLTNSPVIHRVMVEMRKLINMLIVRYGKPDSIVFELAPEAKGSAEDRNSRVRSKLERRIIREKIVGVLKRQGIRKPSREDILRYELWSAFNNRCSLSGKPIPSRLLQTKKVRVEHILPYSRSLNDSYMNKMICLSSESRRLKNNLPSEVLSVTELKSLKSRLEKCSARLPWQKRQSLTTQLIDPDAADKIVERHLNDTSYFSRIICDYLRPLFPEINGSIGQVVRSVRPYISPKLIQDWKLNGVLRSKTVDLTISKDFREKAIRAIAVAMVNVDTVYKLRETDRKRRESGHSISMRRPIVPPWRGFSSHVKSAVAKVIISHKPSRKLSGQLHESTFYGSTDKLDQFVVRKQLSNLSPAMVEAIRDPVIKRLVKSRCSLDRAGRVIAIPQDAFKQPLLMSSGVQVMKARVLIQAKSIVPLGPSRFVMPDKNHHIAIYAIEVKGACAYLAEVVSLFEAVSRNCRGEQIVRKSIPNVSGSRLLYSLCKNDMLALPSGGKKVEIWRVQKFAKNYVQLRRHYFAGSPSDKDNKLLKIGRLLPTIGAEKISVDILGKIQPAND